MPNRFHKAWSCPDGIEHIVQGTWEENEDSSLRIKIQDVVSYLHPMGFDIDPDEFLLEHGANFKEWLTESLADDAIYLAEFNAAVERATDPDKRASLELLRAYLFTPDFQFKLAKFIREINGEAA